MVPMSTPSAHHPRQQNAPFPGEVPTARRRDGESSLNSHGAPAYEPSYSSTLLATFALGCVALLFVLLIGEIGIFILGN